MRSYLLLLPIVLILFVAACYAAEPALPGGVLYWIKTNVSEPTRIAVSYDARTRAERHALFAQRRLAEAEARVGRGESDEMESAALARRFTAYARASYDSFDALAVQDDVAAARLHAEFIAGLVVHDAIIGSMMRASPAWRTQLSLVAEALTAQLHAHEDPDLYEAGAHASAAAMADAAAAQMRAQRAAEATARDAARQVEISGKGTGSIEVAFVKNAEDLLVFSRSERDRAVRRTADDDVRDAYVAYVTALNAASQAERFARAAYAIALGRDRAALRTAAQ